MADFGLAKLIDGDDLTGSRDLVGTLRFMAPERFEGSSDRRSDIYALGVTLYELATLRPAFSAPDQPELIRKILHEAPIVPRLVDRRIPRDLETVILKAMSSAPASRYPIAGGMAEDIRRFLEGRPILARRIGHLERGRLWARRNPGLAALTATVLLLLTTIAAGSVATSFWFRNLAAREHTANTRTEAALGRERAARQGEAEKSNELTWQLYVSQAQRALNESEANRVAEAERLLDECPGEFRGWEWSYIKRLGHLERLNYKGHHERVFSVAISPDGKLAASGAGPWYFDDVADKSLRGELAIWETGTGREILFERGIAGRVLGVAFSPDGRFVAAVGGQREPITEGRLTLRDASTGRAHWSRTVKDANLVCVAFSPDNSTVAAGYGFVDHAESGAIVACKLWDTKSGTEIATLPGRPGGVAGLSFRPDGKAIVLCFQGLAELWDIAGKSLIREFAGLTEIVRSPEFTGGGATLAACDTRSIAFWNVASGTLIRRLSLTTGLSITMSSDGRNFVSASEDSAVQLRDAESGEVITSFRGHDGPVYQVALSRDGRQFLTASGDGTVRVWDVNGGRFHNPDVAPKGGGHRWVQGVAITPDARRVVTAARDNTVRIWDAAGGHPLQTFQGPSGPQNWGDVFWCLAMSPDGRHIVAGHGDGTVHRWDILLGKELPPLRGHSNRVVSVAYSPDGKRIASGSRDQTIRIWDAETGRPLLSLIGHLNSVMALAFNADGSRLASGGGGFEWYRSSGNGEVACWNAFTAPRSSPGRRPAIRSSP